MTAVMEEKEKKACVGRLDSRDLLVPTETGDEGPPGVKGDRGYPGRPGAAAVLNWKECVFNFLNDGRDNGLIKVNLSFKYGRVTFLQEILISLY